MSLTWILIRGSGIAAFALLSASVIWGLMISSKVLGRAVKAKGLQWIHESIGLAAVLATVIHIGALVADSYIEFTWSEVLIPGLSDWEPVAVALGVVSFWTMVLVTFSFYAKRWIGHSTWRTIHFLSYGTLAGALIHGVLAGTDTANPWVAGLYAGILLVVIVLTIIRFAAESAPRPGRPTPTATRSQVERRASTPAGIDT